MKPGRETPQGAQYRARLESMLRQAGPEGAKAPDLLAGMRIGIRMMRGYLRNAEWAYCARTDYCPWIRWYHVDFRCSADDYVAKCNAIKTDYKGGYLSDVSRQAIMAALVAAGEAGMTKRQIAATIGLAPRTVDHAMPKMCREDSVGEGPDVAQRLNRGPVRRYYAPGIAPMQWPAKPELPKRIKAATTPEPKKPRHIPKPLPHQKMTGLDSKKKSHKSIKALVGEAVIPAGLVPVIGPSCRDTRYTPQHVEPFFSAMSPGQYISTGSAIERAYSD